MLPLLVDAYEYDGQRLAEVFLLEDRVRRVLSWLGTLEDDVSGYAVALQLVPPIRVVPDDL